jgi:hypothetical protein
MIALIDIRDGRVCQIEAEEFPVDPRALEWVECDEAITTKHAYIDGEFVAPVVEKVDPTVEIDGELKLLDMKSIRAIREYISKQADAPSILKDKEMEAVALRVKRAK